MEEAGLQEVDTYITFLQNTVTHCIATGTAVDLCLVAEQYLGTSVSNRWWEQEYLYLEVMCKTVRAVEME